MAAGFTLAQLQYFCTVAELGSFTAAAAAQRVSSNAVSSAVNMLEESLGTQLCVRQRSRGVELTPAGHVFYDQAKDLLGRAEEMALSVSGASSETGNPLAVGCAPTLAMPLLTPIVEMLATRRPQARLRLEVGEQGHLLEQLREGRIECALLHDIDLPRDVGTRELYRRTPCVLLSRRHRLASRKSINLLELAYDPLVLLDENPARDHGLRMIRECGVDPDVRYVVSSHEIARGLVSRNLGYAITLLGGVTDTNDDARAIVRIPIAPKPREEAVSIAWTAASGSDPRVKEFVDLATQHAARPGVRMRGR